MLTANRQGPTSTPGSPMKTSKASSSCEKSGSASHQLVPDAHLWAVHMHHSRANRIIMTARKKGEDFMASKVMSVAEAQEWFDHLEFASDANNE
ncbi:hypothetical protein BT96DRAFT_1005108 [Gymnopus androsaceus JB14]|uniref:Uncharacterized protein n=1 Tax=Gymnopus androsaceus JB14 TaxID=1447944 RepID=A0A6A4GPT4_9AGAR|nr:hypothetical protein BT96DRAFT_1005108 [Gymnopus androsaceus JB14]